MIWKGEAEKKLEIIFLLGKAEEFVFFSKDFLLFFSQEGLKDFFRFWPSPQMIKATTRGPLRWLIHSHYLSIIRVTLHVRVLKLYTFNTVTWLVSLIIDRDCDCVKTSEWTAGGGLNGRPLKTGQGAPTNVFSLIKQIVKKRFWCMLQICSGTPPWYPYTCNCHM